MENGFTSIRDLVRAFAGAMDLISPEVQDHHQKVAYLSYRLAEALELPEKDRRLAIYGALLHDVGSVALQRENITLAEVEAQAPKIAQMGRTMLELLPATRTLAQVVGDSQTPWERLHTLRSGLRRTPVIGQIVHLADIVSLLLGDGDGVLNRAGEITACVREMKGEFRPDLLSAFEQVAQRDFVWLDLRYRPNHFLDFLPDGDSVTLEETVKLTELVSQIIDFRSPFTAMHSAGVAASAEFLARAVGMSERECSMMRVAGHLHDLGKLKLSRTILEKPETLTDEEFNLVKEHAYYTHALLKDVRGFDQIVLWAALHHEKLNGTGYPFRLKGEEIPLGARIMAVADVFSAMAEERPYRKGAGKEGTLRVLRENADRCELSGSLVELAADRYEEIDRVREKASRTAGKRYYASVGEKT